MSQISTPQVPMPAPAAMPEPVAPLPTRRRGMIALAVAVVLVVVAGLVAFADHAERQRRGATARVVVHAGRGADLRRSPDDGREHLVTAVRDDPW